MRCPDLSDHDGVFLTDAGTQETSIILYAYLAAGQKIGHRCDHLCAALRT
jgi:hypothetical protein